MQALGGLSGTVALRQYEVTCPECGQKPLGKPPAGLEMDRGFGVRLESTVVYYRQEQHMSWERTERALRDLHGAVTCNDIYREAVLESGLDHQAMRRV